MIELKPCPFCGSEAEIFPPSTNKYGNTQWSVRCVKWHADIQEDCRDDAIAMWNSRIGNKI